MSVADVVLSLVMALLLALAARSVWRRRKRGGCCGCCAGCAGCAHAGYARLCELRVKLLRRAEALSRLRATRR